MRSLINFGTTSRMPGFFLENYSTLVPIHSPVPLQICPEPGWGSLFAKLFKIFALPGVEMTFSWGHVLSCVKPVRWRKHACSGLTKKLLHIFMRFEQNDFKILILAFKNHLHIFWLNSLWSVFFLHVCLRNFPEIRGTENSSSRLKLWLLLIWNFDLTWSRTLTSPDLEIWPHLI